MPPGAAKPTGNGRASEDNGSSGGMAGPRENGHALAGHEREQEQEPPPPVIPAFTPAGSPDLIAVDTTSMQLQWQPICQLPLTIPLDVNGQPVYDAAAIPPCSIEYRLETRTVRCASFLGPMNWPHCWCAAAASALALDWFSCFQKRFGSSPAG